MESSYNMRKSLVSFAIFAGFAVTLITIQLPLDKLNPDPTYIQSLSIYERIEDLSVTSKTHSNLPGTSRFLAPKSLERNSNRSENSIENTIKLPLTSNIPGTSRHLAPKLLVRNSNRSENLIRNDIKLQNRNESLIKNDKVTFLISNNSVGSLQDIFSDYKEKENLVIYENYTGFSIDRHTPKQKPTIAMDFTRRFVRPWESDPQCEHFRIGFATPGALSPRALASYPGSGNTWVRQIVQAAGGVFSGSVFRDYQLYMSGYLGELDHWYTGTTLTQKTHYSDPTHIKQFNGNAVLLLRNPYRAILAYHNYLFGGHTGFAPVSNYRRKDWGSFVHLQTRQWLDMALNWTKLGDSITVIHYELLKQEPIKEITKILKSCGVTPDFDRLKCVEKNKSPGFKRRPQYIPEGLPVFSDTDRDKIDRAIRYVDYLLRQHNHTPLPLHLYHFYNNTESQMQRVKCHPNETYIQCDERVDRLNHSKKKDGVRVGVDGEASEISKLEEIPKKQDPLERFVGTKVGWLLTRAFTGVMKASRYDPITQILTQ